MAFRLASGLSQMIVRQPLSDQAQAFTRQPGMAFVVADDDGSSDGTLPMLRDKQVLVTTGVNIGIAWNKNRALFLLSHMLGSVIAILLKDDTEPNILQWKTEWIRGAVIAHSPAFSLTFGVRLLSRA
jgi:hypothetical protein